MKNELLLKLKRVRNALLASGILNIFFIFFIILWTRETSSPIAELNQTLYKTSKKPIRAEKSTQDILLIMGVKTFRELKTDLTDKPLVENGYTVRDFALSTLISQHHFNIEKAFSKNEKLKQKRKIAYTDSVGKRKEIILFSDAEEEHFDAALAFLKEETWPITPYGMYLKLLESKDHQDPSLVYAFQLSKEFKNLETMMQKAFVSTTSSELLQLVLEGPFDTLKQLNSILFDEEVKEFKRDFLLSYISLGSEVALTLLLRSDFEFAVKKTDDRTVIKILSLLNKKLPQSRKFALALLLSPRAENIWELAAKKMYELSDEMIPEALTRQQALQRFAPVVLTKNIKLEQKPKPLKLAQEKQEPIKLATAAKPPAIEPKPTAIEQKPTEKPVKSEKKGKRAYIVQDGDTLLKVGKRYNANIVEIREINALATDELLPGTLLKLP